MATAYIDPGSPLADYLDDDETALPPSLDEVVTALSTPPHASERSPSHTSGSTTSPASPTTAAPCTSPALLASSPSSASHTSQTSPKTAASPASSASHVSPVRLILPTIPTTPTPISAAPASRSAATTASLSVRPGPSRKLSDDGFAERFKYLICSSALLEKDYVPGLGVDHEDHTSDKSSSPTTGRFPASTSTTDDSRAEARQTIWIQARQVVEPVWTDMQKAVGPGRWDIVLAGAVALLSVGWIMGWKRVLSITVMAVCAVGLWVYLSLDKDGPNTPRLDGDATHLPSRVDRTGNGRIHRYSHQVSSQPSTRSDALETLTGLLTSSRKLDNSIEKSLSHLNPHPTDHQQLHSLRVALHRLTSAMTDNLATATSSLLELVGKDELAVLGEMYDIPVAGSFLYSRKGINAAVAGDGDGDDQSAEADSLIDREVRLGGSVPSPRRPRLSLSLHPNANGNDNGGRYAHPMSMSRSLPAHAPGRHTHTPRSHHLSLSLSPRWSNSPTSATSAPDDRFTSLPNRTPRISKRSSWDVDTWSTVRDQLSPSPSIRARRLSRPSHERRITEADENDAEDRAEVEGTAGTTGLNGNASPQVSGRPADVQYGLSASASVPTSPTAFLRQTRTTRRSPLAGDPNVETLPSNGHFPSPFKMAQSAATTPNSKRRSLQNMPYNPPVSSPPDSAHSGTDVAGAGLTRTRSLPFTDIQSLRERYATGNRSRASSIVNGSPSPLLQYAPEFAVALHSPTPRIRRVVSVSPLTLPSLKAACHAIHMRRRRLACCLLGLRFDQPGSAYWDDVVAAMRELQAQVDTEREQLDEAIADAREQLRAGADGGGRVPEAPWRHRQMDSLDSDASYVNFAPRSSDEQMFKDQIGAIRSTLDKAWKDLDRVNRAVGDLRTGGDVRVANVDAIDAEWSSVRRDLGEMVRSWERGREIIKRMTAEEAARRAQSNGDHADDVEPPESHGEPDPAPEFLRAWSDDGGSPSTSFETDHGPASLDGQADDTSVQTDPRETGDLPLPGKDVVFEVDVPDAAVRERSALSREERIRLTKEARAKGLTLGEMLANSRGGEQEREEQERRMLDRERMRQGGMVLDELRGMMDMIKARKG